MTGRSAVALAICAIALCIPAVASAFHAPGFYQNPATDASGAGGDYFTGSPRFRSYTCDSCHIDVPGLVSLDIATQPPELAAGRYTPGQLYSVTITLVGENKGLDSALNENGMVADFVDDQGQAVGLYEPSETTLIVDEGRAIAARPVSGNTSWKFWYRAPETTLPITLYISAVDGDGNGNGQVQVDVRVDPFGDDVASTSLRVCSVGGPCTDPAADEPLPESAASCSVGSAPSPLAALAFFLLLVYGKPGRRT